MRFDDGLKSILSLILVFFVLSTATIFLNAYAREAERPKRTPSNYAHYVILCLSAFPEPKQITLLKECIDDYWNNTSLDLQNGIVPAMNADEMFKQDNYDMIINECKNLWPHPSQFRRFIDCVWSRL